MTPDRFRILTPLILFFGAFAVSWLYQTPPSLGDDLNYWGLAMDLHQGVPGAWSDTSFHDLRWPVWGLCWLLQIPFGFGALSYYLQPMVYLGAGAVLVRALALEIGTGQWTALLAGILFLFHPQIDSVIDRPMPDLSEGFWVALAFFAWLRLMRSERTGASIALALVVGLALAIGQANRITGVFAVPVLFICTIAFYPRRFLWLVVAGAFALMFVVIEASIYHALTGDWLHSLHANSSARGRKGTETMPLWELPIRFIPAFYRRYSDVIFGLLALVGFVPAIMQLGNRGRSLVAYAVLYLLTYSCALQSIFPPRPLVRDGDRFLASLAFPLSILCALGLAMIAQQLSQRLPLLRRGVLRHPGTWLILLVVGLIPFATRPFRGPNYLEEIADYVKSVPDGTRILSHPAMRHVVSMADAQKTDRFEWTLKKDLLRPEGTTLGVAERSDQIWFIRKWIWTGTRKKSEYDLLEGIGAIAPWLRPPLERWAVARAVAKGDVPDFVFLTRRASNSELSPSAPDGANLSSRFVPQIAVPASWDLTQAPRDPMEFPPVPIPGNLRGKTLFLALEYSSDETEPVRGNVYFWKDGRRIQELTFKPYLFPEPSEDFFFLTIPKDADRVSLRLRVSPKAKWLRLDRFDLLLEKSPDSAPSTQ